MIEIIIALVVALIFSIDGIMALLSSKSSRSKKECTEINKVLKTQLLNMDLTEELFCLQKHKQGINFPRPVLQKGGFTGRGSPFLTRNEYTTMESVEKSIKRIVCR